MLFKNIIYYDVLDSTNSFLKEIVRENKISESMIVVANFQTKGVGQRNNLWESKKNKNLLFSMFICNDKLKSSLINYLNIITSLSIIYTLKKFIGNEEVKIKLPNDILVNNKKISGILTETKISKNYLKEIIIGVGININQEHFSFIGRKSTSLINYTDRKIDKKIFLNSFIVKFNMVYDLFVNKNYEYLQSEFKKNLKVKN
ncbi:MAG: biotin--[acetyl-CoA-carboxylase] ligase [Flavobacteriales bacterium]|nr:biotin--[acetyl-CoA-carboxylase] ligase [Flavobacteriales bacterium]|tara:strand:- start:21394 stop:21999 length:606 start_codon:yes stop_codon:yes gene_type:complete